MRRPQARKYNFKAVHQTQETRSCCSRCYEATTNCLWDCGLHGWFITLFCGYILVTTLPRILVLLDFIITSILFFSLHSGSNKITSFSSLTSLFTDFSFKTSTIDIFGISIFRSIILFICFAYRFQKEGFRKNIYVSLFAVGISSLYEILKLLAVEEVYNVLSESDSLVSAIGYFSNQHDAHALNSIKQHLVRLSGTNASLNDAIDATNLNLNNSSDSGHASQTRTSAVLDIVLFSLMFQYVECVAFFLVRRRRIRYQQEPLPYDAEDAGAAAGGAAAGEEGALALTDPSLHYHRSASVTSATGLTSDLRLSSPAWRPKSKIKHNKHNNKSKHGKNGKNGRNKQISDNYAKLGKYGKYGKYGKNEEKMDRGVQSYHSVSLDNSSDDDMGSNSGEHGDGSQNLRYYQESANAAHGTHGSHATSPIVGSGNNSGRRIMSRLKSLSLDETGDAKYHRIGDDEDLLDASHGTPHAIVAAHGTPLQHEQKQKHKQKKNHNKNKKQKKKKQKNSNNKGVINILRQNSRSKEQTPSSLELHSESNSFDECDASQGTVSAKAALIDESYGSLLSARHHSNSRNNSNSSNGSNISGMGPSGPNREARDRDSKLLAQVMGRSGGGSVGPLDWEQSLSVSVVPESEFTPQEMPLRAPNSDFFNINGVAVHYRVEMNKRNDNKPFFVLIHGFGGGLFSWKQVWNDLLGMSSGLLAFDRPGFGLTERKLSKVSDKTSNVQWGPEDANNPYSTQFSVNIVRVLLDKFGVSNVILISHSTGMPLVCELCVRYPRLVRSVILISPTSGMPGFIKTILKTSLGKAIAMQLVRSEIGQVTLHQVWHKPFHVNPTVVDAYRSVLKLDKWDDALLEMTNVKKPSKQERLRKLRQMSRFVWGRKSFEHLWILHGSEDKLVNYKESVQLKAFFDKYSNLSELESDGNAVGLGAQYGGYGADADAADADEMDGNENWGEYDRCHLIKMYQCGHMPHEEVPRRFVKCVSYILKRTELQNDVESDMAAENENERVDDANDANDGEDGKDAQDAKEREEKEKELENERMERFNELTAMKYDLELSIEGETSEESVSNNSADDGGNHNGNNGNNSGLMSSIHNSIQSSLNFFTRKASNANAKDVNYDQIDVTVNEQNNRTQHYQQSSSGVDE